MTFRIFSKNTQITSHLIKKLKNRSSEIFFISLSTRLTFLFLYPVFFVYNQFCSLVSTNALIYALQFSRDRVLKAYISFLNLYYVYFNYHYHGRSQGRDKGGSAHPTKLIAPPLKNSKTRYYQASLMYFSLIYFVTSKMCSKKKLVDL